MKEPWATLFSFGIVVFFMFLLFFPFIRMGSIGQSFSTDEVCELELGENWAYDYNNHFGSTCVELDFITLGITNRTEYNYDITEIINKYCGEPVGFFDFTRWDNNCDVNVLTDESGGKS